MTPKVHVLITVLKSGQISPASFLVWRTIRTGFPTANIFAYGNGLEHEEQLLASALSGSCGAQFKNIKMRSHGEWIESILNNSNEPFWICDTDIVFFDSVEGWLDHAGHDTLFSGRYEPEFWDDWTRTVHVARLHPSLMWFNPGPLRSAMRSWPGLPEFFGSVERDMIRWHMVPQRNLDGSVTALFYDTCAGLYHALNGTRFNQDQNEAYGHLHCGTYAGIIEGGLDLESTHKAIFENPELARKLLPEQNKWYALHKTRQTLT